MTCFRLLCCFKPKANHSATDEEDEDVNRERRKVLKGETSNDVLKLENLTKVKYSDREKVVKDKIHNSNVRKVKCTEIER